ncbi:MAG TPA: ABC transporter permease, partial [Candidatus Acidoferrum sp.]
MTALRVLISRISGFWSRRRSESRLEEELQCHLEMLEEEARRRGMPPEQASRAARREFGGLDRTKESYRDALGFPFLAALWQDLRHAGRGMLRNPGVTILVVAVLAVGIGACTTVFSILNTLFYRPLSYEDPERLVMMGGAYTRGQQEGPMAPVRYVEYQEWKQARSFERVAAYRPEPFIITAGSGPERVRGERVDAGYFEMLGVRPMMGRGFAAAEYSAAAPPVLILSEEYWRGALNGRADVIGLTLRVDGAFATVVGVMPGRLRATLIEGGPRVWRPLVPTPAELRLDNAAFSVLARLKAGVTLASARAEMAVFSKRFAGNHPDPDRDPTVRVDGLQATLAQASRAPVAKVLIMAVTVLLLISCVNVANLLLGRAAGRQKEVALRIAMGAGRGRLVRHFLSESLALALAGGLAGIGLASLAVTWCSSKMGPLLANDGIEKFLIDSRVLGFALVTSVVTAVVFGLLPACRGSQVNVSDTLKAGGTGNSAGAGRHR